MARRSNSGPLFAFAFPLHVKVLIPPTGLGSLVEETEEWLLEHVGWGSFAHQSGTATTGEHMMTWYFRSAAQAHRFFEAFPSLQLLDRTSVLELPAEQPRPRSHHGAGYGPNMDGSG